MDVSSDFLMQAFMGKPLWMWVGFIALILFLMVLDLGFLHKKQKEVSVRESLTMCSFYLTLACFFGFWVWNVFGAETGANFYTGYFIELSLSMDNLFVMALIFMHFSIPPQHQHRVLFWGILGVIVLRGIMIGAGVMLVEKFEWLLLIFGVFLIFTGMRMLFMKEEEEAIDLQDNRILNFLKRHMRVTSIIDGQKFFIRQADASSGRMVLYATPLFLSLCLIEISDVIFAVDSIPAIFAITTDPYIIFTSNLFAILGLRSLFFALSAVIERFAYMKYALALILAFIGLEIFYGYFVGKPDPVLTLGITLTLLAGGMIVSLDRTARKTKPESRDQG